MRPWTEHGLTLDTQVRLCCKNQRWDAPPHPTRAGIARRRVVLAKAAELIHKALALATLWDTEMSLVDLYHVHGCIHKSMPGNCGC